MNNKAIFLFGAGATYCWNSPSTSELTKLVRRCGFVTTDGIKITEYIYQKLLSSGYSESDANFETIINVIEELIVYYSCFDSEQKTPSILSCFFSARSIDCLLNFSVHGGREKYGYSLEIPAGHVYDYSNSSYNKETPTQFFFQHLLAEILTCISARISKYAYHTDGNSVLNFETTASMDFLHWMQALSGNNVLRIYTLNYDRIFKILMEHGGIKVFEGFDNSQSVGYGGLRANVCRILNDTGCNVFYNLHGSAFWDVKEVDKEDLPNIEVVLTGYPTLQINNSPASIQIERGKTLMVTNIITGYQKAQKSIITPFKQMLSSFDRDCCNGNVIYIIGYSFGDEHINASIKTTIRYNPNARFVIVDPMFIKNRMDLKFALTFFQYQDSQLINPKKLSDNKYSYYDGLFTVYTTTFLEFLRLQNE